MLGVLVGPETSRTAHTKICAGSMFESGNLVEIAHTILTAVLHSLHNQNVDDTKKIPKVN